MHTYLFAYGCSAFVALILTPLVVWTARALRLLDVPDARKVHTRAVPRVGGVAVIVALMAALAAMTPLHTAVTEDLRALGRPMAAILVASGFVFLVGLLDDVRGLGSRLKLGVLLAAAIFVAASGARVMFPSPGVGPAALPASLGGVTAVLNWPGISWTLTVLWICGVTVGMNFVDGLDGLAAGIAAIAAGAIAVVASYYGEVGIAVVAIALLGSLSGFLVFNYNPAKIFLGDSGSMLLGFLVASLGVLLAHRRATPTSLLVPMLAMGVPILDAGFTLVRRGILQRRSLWAAERGHVHHRLLDRGITHRRVVMTLHAVTLLSAAGGVIAMRTKSMTATAAVLGALATLVLLFRWAGLISVRKTLSALRHKSRIERKSGHYRTAFERAQIRLRQCDGFEAWWREVCAAAGDMDVRRLTLPLTRRSGEPYELTWEAEVVPVNQAKGPAGVNGVGVDDEPVGHGRDVLRATVPVRQRRTGVRPVAATVEIRAGTLENAGQALSFFGRLMEEHSLMTLPTPLSPVPRRMAEAPGVEVPLASPAAKGPRVAVVHDFLYTYGGAERVLEQILRVYPDAELHALFDFLPDKERGFLGGRSVKTSFLQRMPMARSRHRHYLPLMPLAVEQLDMSGYDVVISSSYVAAKGVMTRPDQLHVCYCHTPARYAWDLQHQYLETSGLSGGLKSGIARMILHYIRNWDARSSNGVDVFVANSGFVAKRIRKYYRRTSVTIHPPVDVERFPLHVEKEDYYLTASRMVPYKRMDLIAEAFTRLRGRRLLVVGEGPELEKIRAIAGPNVTILGHQPFERLRDYMMRARAFVFAAEEDFGIVPVEAQACGTPVIAYARGGVTESVIDGETGLFFDEQTPAALAAAVERFERMTFDPARIRKHAEQFGDRRFREQFGRLVDSEMRAFGGRSARDGVGGAAESVLMDGRMGLAAEAGKRELL